MWMVSLCKCSITCDCVSERKFLGEKCWWAWLSLKKTIYLQYHQLLLCAVYDCALPSNNITNNNNRNSNSSVRSSNYLLLVETNDVCALFCYRCCCCCCCYMCGYRYQCSCCYCCCYCYAELFKWSAYTLTYSLATAPQLHVCLCVCVW